MWRNCHYVRRASWIVVPLLLFTYPLWLIPWTILHVLASTALVEEEIVNAQKNGSEYPPSWGGGDGGLFGDLF